MFVSHQPFLKKWGCSGERWSCCISINGSRYVLLWVLGIGRAILGAVKERYWFIPSLISWRVFRGDYVVLWLSSLGWRRLACYSYLEVDSLLVLFKLFWSVMVSVGCCQTTSGIGGSFGILVVSGLTLAAPEWRRGVSSLMFGLQLGYSHLSCFGHFFVGLGFVLPVFYSG